MKIKSILEAEEILQKYVLNASQNIGKDLSLDRMHPFLEALGNPHEKLKIIHIAGTSGKTSTAYFISSILKNSNLKVGLTVSPHVDSITERVQINSQPLSENKFCDYLGEFLDKVSKIELEPSYFELLIVFVYWVFDRENVNYAVVETGMGGLLDSTNVADRPDKICVITDIGFDHMNVLGNTISEITFQKAGIIHEGNTVFMYEQSPEIMDQVEKVVEEKGATLEIVQDVDLSLDSFQNSNAPLFQKRNWNLARRVCVYISKRDARALSNSVDALALTVPGRMDTLVLDNGTTLIMDGAHNGQKIATFVESFKDKYPNKKAVILLALKAGKEYAEVINNLEVIADSFILTTFSTSQDIPAISHDPRVLKAYCEQKNIPAEVILDHKDAFKALKQNKNSVKLVIGSFYLLGQIRKSL